MSYDDRDGMFNGYDRHERPSDDTRLVEATIEGSHVEPTSLDLRPSEIAIIPSGDAPAVTLWDASVDSCETTYERDAMVTTLRVRAWTR